MARLMLNGSSDEGSRKRMTEEHSSNTGPGSSAAGGSRLSSEVRNRLGQRLRAVYSSLMHEPVPERFIKLLEKLEATEKAS